MKKLSEQLTGFYAGLQPPALPRGIGILHPQKDGEVMKIVGRFFRKFYHDNKSRRILLGINPGRFGAGITGINFTAPRQLREQCGIEHPWGNSSELSAEFIYEMIDRAGGVAAFYGKFFIGAVSPLGFVKQGKNINYYDDPKLAKAVRPFIITTIRQQLEMGFDRSACLCIGGEKNYRFLSAINEEQDFFREIIPLPHPRFIMQYRRKRKEEFIQQYLDALHSTSNIQNPTFNT